MDLVIDCIGLGRDLVTDKVTPKEADDKIVNFLADSLLKNGYHVYLDSFRIHGTLHLDIKETELFFNPLRKQLEKTLLGIPAGNARILKLSKYLYLVKF